MQIVDAPKPKLETPLGRMMSFLQVGKSIEIPLDELPGETRKIKIHRLCQRVRRIKDSALKGQCHRCFFHNGNYYIERTA